MKIIGDVTIINPGHCYIDLLSDFDLQRVIDNDARDSISSPDDGDLCLTLHDYNVNVYDNDVGCWKKYKMFNVQDRAISSACQNNYCSIYYITISTTGNGEYFGDLSMGRWDSAVFSNGVGDIAVYAGGSMQYNWYKGWSTSAYVNYADYIQISSPSHGSCQFGELDLYKTFCSGTSNAELSTGIVGGGWGGDTWHWELQKYNIKSKESAVHFSYLWQSGTRNGTFFSNATNNRGIYTGGYWGRAQQWYPYRSQVIEFITISTNDGSTLFGTLSGFVEKCNGLSNGELNRGIICLGWNSSGGNVNTIEYITITTTSDSSSFGELNMSRPTTAPTSNRIRNRGVIAGSTDIYTNSIDYLTISTTGNAVDFGDMLEDQRGPKMASNS